jgi:hypothetical protein
VDRFVTDALSILGTAEQASRTGQQTTDLNFVITADGQIRILDASGWSLEALQAEYGAEAVYRVTRRAGVLRVEGRQRGRSCQFTSELPMPTPNLRFQNESVGQRALAASRSDFAGMLASAA